MSTEELIDEMLSGNMVNNITLTDSDELELYNETCKRYGEEPLRLDVKQTKLSDLAKEWLIPQEFLDIDPVEFLISKCTTEEQLIRVQDEILEFHKRDQLIIINLMIYIVSVLRENKIVWGVGRGSSVASYCLFLIGINKIDPLKYGIDYREFFK